MFSKVSMKRFVYNLIDVFMFPNEEIKKIYDEYNVQRCLYQNLTDTDSSSVFLLLFVIQVLLLMKENQEILFLR